MTVYSGPTGARPVPESFEALCLPGIEPERNRFAGDGQNLADLANGMALMAQHDGMSPTTQDRLSP